MKTPHLPEFLLHHLPWDESSQTLWPISTFTLKRNLSSRCFPEKLSEMESLQVKNLLISSLLNTRVFQDGVVIELETLSNEEKQYLFEHFFFSEDVSDQGLHQAVIISKDCQIIATINIGEHLHLHAIDSQGSWHATVEKLYETEQKLSESLEFAFSPRFGYLTVKPHKCGIALSIKAYLHLPILLQPPKKESPIFELEGLDEYLKISQMISLEEENPEQAFYGDLVILENHYNLGVSEDQMLRSLYATANRLINEEATLRSEIKNQEAGDFKDLVSRAFGILKHSYQMPTKDAISALSFVKLGVDLGWIKGLRDDQVNKIFFKSRRAHLLSKEEQPSVTPEDFLHKRAAFIHNEIKNATLTI